MGSVFLNGGLVGVSTDYIKLETLPLTYVGGRVQSSVGTTSNITVSLTSLTGGTDSAPQEGDLVIVALAVNADDTNTLSYRISGYTQVASLGDPDTSNEDIRLQVGYKVMTSTPDTSVTITGGTADVDQAGAIAVHVWRNIDTTVPLDVTHTTALTLSTVRPNPPAITPITSGAVIVAAGGGGHATTGTFSSSDLSNFITINGSDTHDVTVGIGSYAWTSGAFDPAQWTFSGTDNTGYPSAAVTMALRPKIIETNVDGVWLLPAVHAYKRAALSGIEYTYFEDGGNVSSKTYSNVPFGEPTLNRKIIVLVSLEGRSALGAPTVTVAGKPASLLVSAGGALQTSEIYAYSADIIEGRTGNVVVTFPTAENHAISVYRVVSSSSTPHATATVNSGSSLSVAVPNNGAFLAAGITENNTVSLSGSGTLNYFIDIDANDWASGMSGTFVSAATASWTGAGRRVAISWGP